MQSFELDQFDLKILEIIQANNTIPQREIGEAVHLSAASVHRRIKRMEDSGVIRNQVAIIDPAKVGQQVTVIVEVVLENESLKMIDDAKDIFLAAPGVQQCYYVAGEADFILVIIAKTMEEYTAMTRKLFFSNSNIKRFRTFVVMDKVRVGLSVPIDKK